MNKLIEIIYIKKTEIKYLEILVVMKKKEKF